MRQLQPVIWAKGTFLTPNHLQAQDQYWDSLINFRTEALGFRSWGFLSLELDPDALARGLLTIREASGIFPDGLVFDIPAADPAPPSKSILDYFKSESEVDIFLALPAYRYGAMNVASPRQNADTRFIAEYLEVRDENNGRMERPIQIAHKNFRLLAGSEVQSGMPVLHMARIRQNSTGLPELDPDFIPHLLDISAGLRLLKLTRDVVEILTARGTDLSNARRHRAPGLAEFTSSDIADFWLLYTVNTYLPLLRHLLETRRGHPELLFSTLISIGGALTTFSPSIAPGDLPLYDHADLTTCFRELEIKLRVLLDAVIRQNFIALPMKLKQPYVYACDLKEEEYLRSRMYLAIKAEAKEAELVNLAPTLLVVHSAAQIARNLKQTSGGLRLHHVPVPPAAIRVKLEFQYFSLNLAGEAWEAIQRDRSVAVWVPGQFPNPLLELVLLPPETR